MLYYYIDSMIPYRNILTSIPHSRSYQMSIHEYLQEWMQCQYRLCESSDFPDFVDNFPDFCRFLYYISDFM